ncbi:MAG: carboxypeptidase-like regulatory domain-containing protein [Chloroflexi bacterium]|nr:carboxypeptidase-like regulatory domain-containing protein [Chloroflexota bacterium]
MRCAVCNAEIDEGTIACPQCGTEQDERILPFIKQWVVRVAVRRFKATSRRTRIAIGVIALLLLAIGALQAFPGNGTVKGHVTWKDAVGMYPVVGARVLVIRDGNLTQADQTTDDRGRFSIELPVGDIDLVVADLVSDKVGQEDFRVTDRFWLVRFWKKHLHVNRGGVVDLSLDQSNLSPAELKYFSAGQLQDYRNRAGWTMNGPFTEKQIAGALNK